MAKKDVNIQEGEIVNDNNNHHECCQKRKGDGRLVLGAIFILFGGLIFLNNFYPQIEVGKYFFPIALIFLGLMLIIRSL